jgi:hypothetical protein
VIKVIKDSTVLPVDEPTFVSLSAWWKGFFDGGYCGGISRFKILFMGVFNGT